MGGGPEGLCGEWTAFFEDRGQVIALDVLAIQHDSLCLLSLARAATALALPGPGGLVRAGGADAFEQDAGGFVVGVLRHQFAAEGLGEQGRREAFDLGAGGDVAGLNAVGEGEQGFDAADDLGLFIKGWAVNLDIVENGKINSLCYVWCG